MKGYLADCPYVDGDTNHIAPSFASKPEGAWKYTNRAFAKNHCLVLNERYREVKLATGICKDFQVEELGPKHFVVSCTIQQGPRISPLFSTLFFQNP